MSDTPVKIPYIEAMPLEMVVGAYEDSCRFLDDYPPSCIKVDLSDLSLAEVDHIVYGDPDVRIGDAITTLAAKFSDLHTLQPRSGMWAKGHRVEVDGLDYHSQVQFNDGGEHATWTRVDLLSQRRSGFPFRCRTSTEGRK